MGTNCHLWACQVSIHCVFFGFYVPFKLQCQMNPGKFESSGYVLMRMLRVDHHSTDSHSLA